MSITPIPEETMPSFGLCGQQTFMEHRPRRLLVLTIGNIVASSSLSQHFCRKFPELLYQALYLILCFLLALGIQKTVPSIRYQ